MRLIGDLFYPRDIVVCCFFHSISVFKMIAKTSNDVMETRFNYIGKIINKPSYRPMRMLKPKGGMLAIKQIKQ